MTVREVGTLRYRIICANPDHRYHHYDQASKGKAVARVVELNADPPANPTLSQRGCEPWRVEAQAVTRWDNPEAVELALWGAGRTLDGSLSFIAEGTEPT